MTVKAELAAIKYGDGASPETFAAIASVTDFSGVGGTRAMIKTTTLASTVHEQISGLLKYGPVQANLLWDSDNVPDAAIWAKLQSGAVGNFQVVFPNSPEDVFSFAAYVADFQFQTSEDDVIKGTCTFEPAGTLTDTI